MMAKIINPPYFFRSSSVLGPLEQSFYTSDSANPVLNTYFSNTENSIHNRLDEFEALRCLYKTLMKEK